MFNFLLADICMYLSRIVQTSSGTLIHLWRSSSLPVIHPFERRILQSFFHFLGQFQQLAHSLRNPRRVENVRELKERRASSGLHL
jgi:hypothetical protein